MKQPEHKYKRYIFGYYKPNGDEFDFIMTDAMELPEALGSYIAAQYLLSKNNKADSFINPVMGNK